MGKKDILSKVGALNKKKQVTNPLFLEHNFFDPIDNVQIKYEMLRARLVDNQKVSHICKQFSYSRIAFYVILKKFKKEGTAGLLEGSHQRKNTIMLNQDIVNKIIQIKFNRPDISGSELTQKINETFDTDYKKRAIETAVKRLDLIKKKPRLK